MSILTTDESSKKCYDDLKANGLVKPNYTTWCTKSKGVMEGVTLFGKTKISLPKKVFVKNYKETYDGLPLSEYVSDIDSLQDYAAFTILKKCGARTPKVKLNATAQGVYIFATDIAQKKNKSPQKNYWFLELNNLPYKIDAAHRTLTPIVDNAPVNKTIPLDKFNLIRTILLAQILNLDDLNSTNIGFVISDYNSNTKSKLACIDFKIPKLTPCESSWKSLKEVIYYGLSNNFRNLDLIGNGCSLLINSFTESDYLEAFKKIEDNFLITCNDVKSKINEMTFETTERKTEAYAVIDSWYQRFLGMQKLADNIRNHQPENDVAVEYKA